MSAGLRSRHRFPHYLILCQVTGETLGGVSLGGGVSFQLVFRDVLTQTCFHEVIQQPSSHVGFLEPISPEAVVRIRAVCLPTELKSVSCFN